VTASDSDLIADSIPFTELADASMAMTAHVIYEAWDPRHCASLSAQVIQEQIRGRMGFDGLLISDDLDMKALSGDIPERAAAVLAAGCDIALNCWGRLDDMKGIAEQVPAMTADATERISRACALLRIAQGSSALNARIDELVARRDSLA
jgi:beta-N-acetylhexosaminidase